MKKRAILAAALALTLLAGCSAVPDEALQPPSHTLELTQAEKLADYEYLWDTLESSYPGWGILSRQGTDVRSLRSEYRTMLESSADDADFYRAIYSALFRMNGVCHLSLLEPEDYARYRTLFAEDKPYWDRVLNAPVSVQGYEKAARLLEEMGAEDGSEGPRTTSDNLHSLICGTTAYLKIDQFDDRERDRAAILDFYRSAAGCTDLIFDLTDNSGGDERYWQELLVAPNIDAPLSCSNYALVRKSEQNAPYLEAAFSPDALQSIDRLPPLPGLDPADRAFATHFLTSTLSVEPGERSPFRGRVWLLVGPRVYSASESFSLFSRQTGFATLVGEPTGGDGVGALDPVYLTLPHSGLIVRYNMLLGLNSDGSPSQEAGTRPHLPAPPGEPALVTALRAIEELR